MYKMISLCHLIVIGVLAWSTAVLSSPVAAPKSDFHLMFENNWPDPDPNINRFPHQTSCHYFYLVLSEEDISIRKCHDGKLFDYVVHKCVEKESAKCWSHHFSAINHDHHLLHKTHKKFKCPYAYGKFPDITDCTRYYQCLSGKAKSKKCAPYESFDKIKRKCMAEIQAVCADETDVVEHDYKCPRTWGSFSFSKDCSKYYECIEKRPDLMTCPRHALFDEKKRKCISHKSVRCGSRHNPYAEETTLILSTPTGVSSQQTTDEIIEFQKDTSQISSQYPSSYDKPLLTTSNEIESSSIAISKSDKDNSVNKGVSDIPYKGYDSSENDASKESRESSENHKKDSSEESKESSEDHKKDNSKESKDSSEDDKKDVLKISKESSEDHKKDNSKESKESSEDHKKDDSKVKKESSEDHKKDDSKESKESSEDHKKDDSKESKKESKDDSHDKNVSKESAEAPKLESSVNTNEFITTVEILPSDKSSTNQDTVTTSNRQSSTETYSSPKDEKVCLPDDPTCIRAKDGIIRCPAANGLFPHPEDERRFLHCRNFRVRVKTCPEKLIFKNFLKACAWPLNVAQNNA